MKSEQQTQRMIRPVRHINDLLAQIRKYASSHLGFVGLGNRDRADDGAGLLFLDRLAQIRALEAARFLSAGPTPENHLEEIVRWQPACVIFIDAARGDGKPGEIAWVTPGQFSVPEFSTHAYSLHLIELYLTNRFPMEVKYLGIQPFSTNYGVVLSAALQTSLHQFFN